jgi:hypothetical protein
MFKNEQINDEIFLAVVVFFNIIENSIGILA